MTTTIDAAQDEMFALFKAAWDAGAEAIVGYVPEVRWQGKEKPSKPDNSKFWCRVSTNNVLEEQSTITDCVQTPFVKRYTNSGLLFVQIFSPMAEANADRFGLKLAKLARSAYRGKTTVPGGVLFRRVRINNLPIEEKSYRHNVVAEYEFDEIG